VPYIAGMASLQNWDPVRFLALMRERIPDYDRLQDETVAATGDDAKRVLELGTGTGETARRVLARHPSAMLVGVDASSEILERARAMLPTDRVDLRVAELQDPLPDGRFDLVVSVLAVHHLNGLQKAELFRRVAERLTARGRVVIGDFVIPNDPADVVTEMDPEYDTPSTIADQLRWLTQAGLCGGSSGHIAISRCCPRSRRR
jgi:tRNA (cmo5U34)-methyltransferase